MRYLVNGKLKVWNEQKLSELKGKVVEKGLPFGIPLNEKDLLHQIEMCKKLRISVQKLADALNMDVDYLLDFINENRATKER